LFFIELRGWSEQLGEKVRIMDRRTVSVLESGGDAARDRGSSLNAAVGTYTP
jgi:hypothetical protein